MRRWLTLLGIVGVTVLFMLTTNHWLHWVGYGLAVSGMLGMGFLKPKPESEPTKIEAA